MSASEEIIEIPSAKDENHMTEESTSVLKTSESLGLTLSCHNLCYTVKGKEILQGINAVFRPGRVTAVMGSSGAGKTTLLSLLAGNAGNMGSSSAKQGISLNGSVKLNGVGVDLASGGIEKVSGFVYQDDVILPTMTVEEAVLMSARLRLPRGSTDEQLRLRCKQMLELLGIEKCAKTKIGSATVKGISGGERKRVALAMEMIPNPSILFLDEPTSGLDTVNAYNVVSHLTSLAHDHNRTIVLTIHQPPSEVYHMIDDLLLLAGGRVVYHGPAQGAVAYFAALGFPCPLYTNPADFFFLELLGDVHNPLLTSGEDDKSETASTLLRSNAADERAKMLTDSWQESGLNARIVKECEAEGAERLNLRGFSKQKSSFGRQFFFLMKRAARNLIRDRMLLPAKIMQTVVIGLLFGLVYWDIRGGNKELEALFMNISGCLYFLVVNQFMSSAMGILSVFTKEKIVFLREHRLGYYQLPAYFLSKMTVELPYQIFFPFLLVSIVYSMTGLRAGFDHFMVTCIVVILTALNGMALGTLAATLFSSLEVALVVLPLLLIPMMVFSGLMVSLKDVKPYFAWIPVISPTQYAYRAIMKNEYEGDVFTDPRGFKMTGEQYLSNRGLAGGLGVWENVAVLGASYVILMTAAYLALYLASRRGK